MRLIDADALNPDDIPCYYGSSCYTEEVEEWLNDAPTIDAVPVVRCKDCDHKHAVSCEGIVLCTYRGKMIQMKPSDFCSYGERKDGEG